MRYCPVSSVTPVRTLVMSAGLDASTVTPGGTAPDVSRTAPARLCAVARLGPAPTIAITINDRISIRFMGENLHAACATKRTFIDTPRMRGLWTFRLRRVKEARGALSTRGAPALLPPAVALLHRQDPHECFSQAKLEGFCRMA